MARRDCFAMVLMYQNTEKNLAFSTAYLLTLLINDPHPPKSIWDSASSALHNDVHENFPVSCISGQSKVVSRKHPPYLFVSHTPRGVYKIFK
jgi:hypothetical protein